MPLTLLRTLRLPFKIHRLKPPIAGPCAVVTSSHIIMVSKTYADAPSGGIHNSTFLSSEDSHNLMFLRETNEKSAPFRAYHGFVRKDDSIPPVIQFPAFLFPFETTAFAFSHILYPLSYRLILRSPYCIYRWQRAYQVPHLIDTTRLGGFFTPGKIRDASQQLYESIFPLANTQANLCTILS